MTTWVSSQIVYYNLADENVEGATQITVPDGGTVYATDISYGDWTTPVTIEQHLFGGQFNGALAIEKDTVNRRQEPKIGSDGWAQFTTIGPAFVTVNFRATSSICLIQDASQTRITRPHWDPDTGQTTDAVPSSSIRYFAALLSSFVSNEHQPVSNINSPVSFSTYTPRAFTYDLYIEGFLGTPQIAVLETINLEEQ